MSKKEDMWELSVSMLTGAQRNAGLIVEVNKSFKNLFDRYIEFYQKLPTDNRPNRESGLLRFKFSREFFYDACINEKNKIQRINRKVKETIKSFDFSRADHSFGKETRVYIYTIYSDGSVVLQG